MNRQKEKAVALNVQLCFHRFNNNINPHTDCLNGAGVAAVIIFFYVLANTAKSIAVHKQPSQLFMVLYISVSVAPVVVTSSIMRICFPLSFVGSVTVKQLSRLLSRSFLPSVFCYAVFLVFATALTVGMPVISEISRHIFSVWL